MPKNEIYRARDGRLLTETEVENWQELSKCTPETASLFDVGDIYANRKVIEAAKFICAQCDVAALCLEAAIDSTAADEPAVGTWGGLTDKERSGSVHGNGPVAEKPVFQLAKRVLSGESIIEAPQQNTAPQIAYEGYDGPKRIEEAHKARVDKARQEVQQVLDFETLFIPAPKKRSAKSNDSEGLLLTFAQSSYLAELFERRNSGESDN